MTTWHPAHTATQEQSERAMELLKESLYRHTWEPGKVLAEESGVQYRANWHPNKSGTGQHQGVEVWLPESGGAAMTAPWKPDPKNRASAEERELVLAEFVKRGWPREEADAMIAIESGWDPTARNVQQFGGLIGFSPKLQRDWHVFPVWNLSAAQQAPLVGKYLDGVGKHWRVPGDTYLTGAAPAYVGAPDAQVIYPHGSKAWEQNPGWRPPDGGSITAGSIRATLLRRLAKGGAGYSPAPKESPESLEPQSLSFFLEALRSALHPTGHITGSGSEVAAVVAYQRSQGLFGDGRIGEKTLGRMLEQLKKDEPA
jgi:hypothetical protein